MRFKGNSIYSVLERLGCSPKVPRSRHEKADVREQERWKKGAGTFAEEGGSKSGNTDRFRRRDESRPWWNGSAGVGSARAEGGPETPVALRVEALLPGGGLCTREAGMGMDGLDEV